MKLVCLLAVIAISTALRLHTAEHLSEPSLHDLVFDHLQFGMNQPQYSQQYGGPRTQQPTQQQFLASLPPGPLVNGQNAMMLRDWFATPMGKTVLSYFNSRTTQANGRQGLNLYNLTDPNFRLWMAIKILADRDQEMYLRSLAQDPSLFNEYMQKRNTV